MDDNVGGGVHAPHVDIASAITASTAAISTGLSLFLLRQGQRDRRDLRLEAERAQARQVSGWADWDRDSSHRDARTQNVAAIWVANASDAAVFDVFVDYFRPGDGKLLRDSIGPVPPGSQRKLDVEIAGIVDSDWEPAAMFPRIYFRDSAYRCWIRDSVGRLRVDDEWGNDDFFERGGEIVRPSAQAPG